MHNPAPFASLEALRSEHSRLLRASKDPAESERLATEVVKLLGRTVATGARLDFPADREAAQSMLDYWTATLFTLPNGVSAAQALPSVIPGATPEAVNLQLSEFDPDTLVRAITDTDEWLATLDAEDRTLFRRILLRLVHLDNDGKVKLLPATQDSFNYLVPRGQVDHILAQLTDLGVVRIASSESGDRQIALRSDRLLANWALLQEWIDERRRFRAAANEWSEKRATLEMPQSGFGCFVKRTLLSIGKRIESYWAAWLRAVGGSLLNPDSEYDFPDAEYYRRKSSIEFDYLYENKLLKEESSEWRRIVASLCFLFIGALLATGGVGLVVRKIELAEARVEGKNNELEQRRKRQRLKEYIGLVRLLAQYRRFQETQPPRAEIAEWSCEDFLRSVDRDELEIYKRELAELDVDLGGGDSLCAECSEHSLRVAHNLRERVINKRIDPANKAEFDKDTAAYISTLKHINYGLVERIVGRIVDIYAGQSTRATDNFRTANAYTDEFWVLYWGEMGTVESKPIEAAMMKFGDRLGEVADAIVRLIEAREELELKVGHRQTVFRPDLDRLSMAGQFQSKSNTKTADEIVKAFNEWTFTGNDRVSEVLISNLKQAQTDLINQMHDEVPELRSRNK